jgi:FO synthase
MHAVSRLYLHPIIKNIQTSWVKLGKNAALSCLNAGANDLGGTLMDESISKSAGGIHGQEFYPREMESFIQDMKRIPVLRDTLYNPINQTSLPNQSSLMLSDKIHSLVDSAYPVI